MRYGILSDIHSNLEALEAVLSALGSERVDRLLCAGDLVGYGADPVPCVKRLRSNGVVAVCGNHDWAAVGRMPLDWFNEQAAAAARWTQGHLTSEEKAFLNELPLAWTDGQVSLVHGSFCEPAEFHYVMDFQEARLCLDLQKTPVAFIGHTHVPGFFQEEAGQVRFARPGRITLQQGRRTLVNVGSVGQPRDGDPRAAYCVYDSEGGSIEIRRAAYPLERTQEKIRMAGLPEFLAARLATGY